MINKLLLGFFGVLIIILLWAGSGILIHNHFSDETARGTFGDMFGAVNALFSGLALFGIITTIIIQQKELTLQREELSDTRLEFQITRITNIIYNQLKRMEEKVDKCLFYDPTVISLDLDRNNRFEMINQYFLIPNLDYIDSGRQKWEESKHKVNLDNILLRNEKEIDNVLNVLSDSCMIVKGLIENTSIRSENKEELKLIFFKNIETELMILVINMERLISKNDESTDNLSPATLDSLKKNLKSIIEFKNLKFPKEDVVST